MADLASAFQQRVESPGFGSGALGPGWAHSGKPAKQVLGRWCPERCKTRPLRTCILDVCLYGVLGACRFAVQTRPLAESSATRSRNRARRSSATLGRAEGKLARLAGAEAGEGVSGHVDGKSKFWRASARWSGRVLAWTQNVKVSSNGRGNGADAADSSSKRCLRTTVRDRRLEDEWLAPGRCSGRWMR
jgi:hypothetical protein